MAPPVAQPTRWARTNTKAVMAEVAALAAKAATEISAAMAEVVVIAALLAMGTMDRATAWVMVHLDQGAQEHRKVAQLASKAPLAQAGQDMGMRAMVQGEEAVLAANLHPAVRVLKALPAAMA